jgi:hypothetical protein
MTLLLRQLLGPARLSRDFLAVNIRSSMWNRILQAKEF